MARYFSPETKAQIAELTAELRLALKARIERLNWMSKRTKRKALDKLARLNVKIGYPDKWQAYGQNIDPRLRFKELKRVDCCRALRGFTGRPRKQCSVAPGRLPAAPLSLHRCNWPPATGIIETFPPGYAAS